MIKVNDNSLQQALVPFIKSGESFECTFDWSTISGFSCQLCLESDIVIPRRCIEMFGFSNGYLLFETMLRYPFLYLFHC